MVAIFMFDPFNTTNLFLYSQKTSETGGFLMLSKGIEGDQ